jgi:GxxExxY protein
MIDTSIYKDLSYQIIGAAMDVHNELGPGFPEKVYQEGLIIALNQRHIPVLKEVAFDVAFRGQMVGSFRVDLLVDQAVIVELKALQGLDATCEQQIIAYLATTGRELGLLLNFGRGSLERKRFVPPKAIQKSPAYQKRRQQWKPTWLQKQKSAPSAKSAEAKQ